MMLQLVYILSWPVLQRESSLGIKQECVVGARQLVAEPRWVAGSKARPATWASADSHTQCHAHTQSRAARSHVSAAMIGEPKTGCVRKRWCWTIRIITRRAKCNGYNSLMQIKIDMLLIIFKLVRPPRGFAQFFHKISNNHEGQRSSPCFSQTQLLTTC